MEPYRDQAIPCIEQKEKELIDGDFKVKGEDL